MAVAASFFFASVAGLWILFVFKAIELRRGRRFMSRIMDKADALALALKRFLMDARIILSRIPPLLMYLSRYALRELALGAAKFARGIESEMHRVADLVSHKRSFERREPRSEFLKKVSERREAPQDESREV